MRLRLRPGGPSRSLKNLWQEAVYSPLAAGMWSRLLWVGEHLAWIAGVGVATEFQCPPGEAGILPHWSVFP